MNDAIRERVAVALEFQSKLRQMTGFKPEIAGGAARDVYYGYVPKDFDLIFDQNASMGDTHFALVLMGFKPSPVIYMYDKESSCDRIRGVIKVKYKEIDFDVIFYAIAEDESVTDYFDVNFNQFILQGHTAIYCGNPDDWNTTYGGVKHLRVIRGDASEKRIAYITDKYMRYQMARVGNAMRAYERDSVSRAYE